MTRSGVTHTGQTVGGSGKVFAPPIDASSVIAAHAILDGSVHTDSVADAVTRGSIIYGNSTPAWDELVAGAAGTFLASDGTDVAWNGTVVTAAAVIADHSIVRGAGGARGVQDSGVLIDDADAMSGLTKLTVDLLEIDGNTITAAGAGTIVLTPTGAAGAVDVYFVGAATDNRDAFMLSNTAWASSMTDTRTSCLFKLAESSSSLEPAARITVGTEGNWTTSNATQDAYMAFQTALNGTVAEKMRINSVGAVGIGTTDPGGNIVSDLLDIRNDADRCTTGMYTYHATANRGSTYYGGRARGNIGTPSIVQDGDRVFAFIGVGYDGSAWKAAAKIIFAVDGTPASGAVPTTIAFQTGATAVTIADRFTIQSDGDILVDSGSKMMFRDSDLFVQSSADGQLDIDADVTLDLTSPTINLTASTVVAVTTAALSLNATGIAIPTANGINYAPGGDNDVDVITVDVTDAPRIWWDESEDEFATTKHLNIAGGWLGTFTNGDGDTVTVRDGVITGVV